MGKGHHSCGVAICRNTSINAKKRGLVIHFFRFPQNPVVRKEWIVKCYRSDKSFNPSNARICSDHFTLNDYEDSIKAQIMGETPIKLKKNAVPTLLLLPVKPQNQDSCLTKLIPTKEVREIIDKPLTETENSDQEPVTDKSTVLEAFSTFSVLYDKIKSLEDEVSDLNRKLKENEESAQRKIVSLQKENNELKKVLSLNQEDFIINLLDSSSPKRLCMEGLIENQIQLDKS